MVDATYPLRVLKHKFGNAAIYHEGKTILTAGVLGLTLGVGGTYIALDEMEDNIQSDQAPQAMQRINSELATLTEQKQNISNIKNEIDNQEFTPSSNELYTLQKQEKQAIKTFRNNAKDTLDYIITNKHLSEQQISGLWHNLSDNIVIPKEVGGYNYRDDYDFGFVKEVRSEILSTSSSLTMPELASEITKGLRNKEKQKEMSALGLFGMLMFAPFMVFANSSTARKWANEKPKRRKKVKSQFKH